MEEIKLSTRMLFMSAVIALIILLTGPLGYRFELTPLQPSLASLLVAVAGGALVVLVGAFYLLIAIRNKQARNRNILLLSILISLVPAAVILPQMAKARSVPPIHDISTDTETPPVFVALRQVRSNAPNGFEYGKSAAWPKSKLAEVTREAYPGVRPLISDLSVADAMDRTVTTLSAMGLEIIDVDQAVGRVEATATTAWFGFKDDVVVRVAAEGDGSRVDLRSMSRVGQSDLGVNAMRIKAFIERF